MPVPASNRGSGGGSSASSDLDVTRARFQQQLAEMQSSFDQLASFGSQYETLTGVLESLPKKMSHDIMVPFGRGLFFEGHLEHTNEVVMHVGESYYCERTVANALKTIRDRKQENANLMAAQEKAMEALRKEEAMLFDENLMLGRESRDGRGGGTKIAATAASSGGGAPGPKKTAPLGGAAAPVKETIVEKEDPAAQVILDVDVDENELIHDEDDVDQEQEQEQDRAVSAEEAARHLGRFVEIEEKEGEMEDWIRVEKSSSPSARPLPSPKEKLPAYPREAAHVDVADADAALAERLAREFSLAAARTTATAATDEADVSARNRGDTSEDDPLALLRQMEETEEKMQSSCRDQELESRESADSHSAMPSLGDSIAELARKQAWFDEMHRDLEQPTPRVLPNTNVTRLPGVEDGVLADVKRKATRSYDGGSLTKAGAKKVNPILEVNDRIVSERVLDLLGCEERNIVDEKQKWGSSAEPSSQSSSPQKQAEGLEIPPNKKEPLMVKALAEPLIQEVIRSRETESSGNKGNDADWQESVDAACSSTKVRLETPKSVTFDERPEVVVHTEEKPLAAPTKRVSKFKQERMARANMM
eukprot:g12866.t1